MKLHSIAIENLNSLYGSHRIDLENDLHGAPVFLIMGPTGSGKSTILDAICLALFGQTPRLQRLKGRVDSDSRQVMSQGTGSCTASVDFSKLHPDGTRTHYRATWYCARARSKPDGNLQDPIRTLERISEDGDVVEVLVSDKRAKYTEKHFDHVLEGLTVEDFKRSMILAQGDFAAFLKASPNDKASILERLTDTEIYKRIGQRTAEHMRRTRVALETVQARAGALSLLSEEELTSAREQLAHAQAIDAQCNDAKLALEHATRWSAEHTSRTTQHAQTHALLETTQAALDSRADDFQRLEIDSKIRPLIALNTSIQTTEQDLQLRSQQRTSLQEKERALQIDLPRAAHREVAARDSLTDTEETTAEVRPLLTQARLKHQSSQDRSERLQDTHAKLRVARSEHTHTQTLLTSSQSQLSQTHTQLEHAKQTLSSLQNLQPLIASATSLLQTTKSLQNEQNSIQSLQKRLDATRNTERELTQQLTPKTEALTPLLEELQSLQNQHNSAQEHIRAILPNHTPDPSTARDSIRANISKTRAQLAHLEDALRTSKKLLELQTTRALTADNIDRNETSLLAFQTRIVELDAEIQHSSTRLLDLKNNLQDVLLALNLAEERAKLTPHSPCPLCGSENHPYTDQDDIHQLDDRLRARHQTLQDNIHTLDTANIQAQEQKTKILLKSERIDQKIKTLRATEEHLETQRQTLVQDLADQIALAEVYAANDEESLREEHTSLTHSLKTLEQQLDNLDSALKTSNEISSKLQKHSATVSQLRSEIALLHGRLDDTRTLCETFQNDLQTSQNTLQTQLSSLHEQLTTLPLDLPPQPSLHAIQTALTNIQTQSGNLEEARTAVQTAQASLDSKQHEHANLQAQLQTLSQRIEELQNTIRDEEATLQEHNTSFQNDLRNIADRIPNFDPETTLSFSSLEHTLDALLQTARQELDEARANRERIETERAQAAQSAHERSEHINSLQNTLNDLKSQAEQLAQELNLDPSEDLTSRTLSDEERDQLQSELSSLQNQHTTAQTRLQLLSEQLQTLNQSPPSPITIPAPEPNTQPITFDPKDTEALQTHTSTLHELTSQNLHTLVALQKTLQDHAARSQQAGDLAHELQTAQHDHHVALELHKLIGVNDGDSFREFAQILNLQELIDKANDRLQWLAPRYTLTIGHDKNDLPTLDFAVRDVHYANRERPMTTLSGGETFLVSLALALALADFRTIDMPIETLLLDEGLGTLDSESLAIVMNALERLHNDGTQIGIISHVESLHEAVHAQVILTPQGAGRSEIRIKTQG